MNHWVRVYALCFVLLFLNACSKDEPIPEKTDVMEAKVNGALWSPSSIKCVLLIDNTLNFRLIDFTATSSGKTVTVEAADNSTGATVNSGTRTFVAGTAYFNYSASSIAFHTISGRVNITDVEPSLQRVSGTFDFTVEDKDGNQIHLSDGKLTKVSYSVKNQ